MQHFLGGRKAAALTFLLQGTLCTALSTQGAQGKGQHVLSATSIANNNHEAEANPVQKVISLLGSLEVKLNTAAEKEEVAYKKFSEWCRGGTKDKEYEIKTAKANIEGLEATIAKADSDITAGSSKIQDLASTISGNDADLKAATEVREKEKADFVAAEAELLDAVDTLDRAVNLLERKMKASALLQSKAHEDVDVKNVDKLIKSLSVVVDAAALSLHDKQRLIGLVQSHANAQDEEDDMQAPTPDPYKFHSGGIIDVLEDMREKAEAQLAELRKQEVNAKHNYELTKQSVEDQIAADQKDMDEAKVASATATETKANAEGDLSVTKKDLADAEKSLELMTSSCMSAATDHETSVKARTEELQVIAEAKKVLLENTSGAASVSYSFLQVSNGGSTRLSTRADLVNYEVVSAVRRLASKEKSPALAQLASRIQAALNYGQQSGEDVFAKVKALISDMIVRLQEEAGQEASHKAYCDKEMAGTQEKIDDLSYSLERLGSKVDKKKATSTNLKNEVQELQAELADIAKSQVDLDEVRREESKTFAEKKADLQLGLTGVRQALRVLKEYYAKEPASLLQKKATLGQDPELPEYHEAAADASTGIIGLLEVIEADFGKSLAQAEMEEDSAATEYEKISMQNRVTKVTKEQDVKYKTKESAELDKSIAELSSDRESTQTELDAVLEYSKTLRAQCIVTPETYEERTARREAEIAGLREALSILEGEVAFLEKPKKALRGHQ
mmetsp:Transcript_36880/g.78254  ORF Transcript_36880/g.78254 Transcript_36880/m.78254 type:complete len:735 (+) Transcript_36880:169-2373(+)